jgi:HK97 family phage major capsid protein
MPTGSGSFSGATMILLGDLSASSVIGSRRNVLVQASTQRWMELDQVAFRGTHRFDVVNHTLGNNTSAGAMVGLVGG